MNFILQSLGILILAPFALAFSIFVLAKIIDISTDALEWLIVYLFKRFSKDEHEDEA